MRAADAEQQGGFLAAAAGEGERQGDGLAFGFAHSVLKGNGARLHVPFRGRAFREAPRRRAGIPRSPDTPPSSPSEAGVMTSVSVSSTARSMTFSSSRILPSQRRVMSMRMAAGLTPRCSARMSRCIF